VILGVLEAEDRQDLSSYCGHVIAVRGKESPEERCGNRL
jgi:hypothetical protein